MNWLKKAQEELNEYVYPNQFSTSFDLAKPTDIRIMNRQQVIDWAEVINHDDESYPYEYTDEEIEQIVGLD